MSAANHQEGRVESEITGSVVTWTCSHILAGLWENDVPKCPKIEMLQTLGKGKTAESHRAKCPPCPLQRERGHCRAGSSSRVHSSHTKPTSLSLHPEFSQAQLQGSHPLCRLSSLLTFSSSKTSLSLLPSIPPCIRNLPGLLDHEHHSQ